MLPQEEGAQYWRENPEDYNCSGRDASNFEHPAPKFTLSPNPASEVLHIQFEIPLIGELIMSDLSGRMIQALYIKEETRALDVPVAHLENGVYILSFSDASGKLPTTAKFAIVR